MQFRTRSQGNMSPSFRVGLPTSNNLIPSQGCPLANLIWTVAYRFSFPRKVEILLSWELIWTHHTVCLWFVLIQVNNVIGFTMVQKYSVEIVLWNLSVPRLPKCGTVLPYHAGQWQWARDQSTTVTEESSYCSSLLCAVIKSALY